MIMCGKCFNSVLDNTSECLHNSYKFDIDESIFNTISILNKKGYITEFCCGGHVNKDVLYNHCKPNIYIKFNNNIYNCISDIPDGFKKERCSCIIRYIVPVEKYIIYKMGIPKRVQDYKSLITDDVLYKVEKDLDNKREALLNWAMLLPSIK